VPASELLAEIRHLRHQVQGATRSLRWIANVEPDPKEGVRPLDDLLDRIQDEALARLRLLEDGHDARL
jgi:hypothetical protein